MRVPVTLYRMVLCGTVWYCVVLHCVVEYNQLSASAGNVVSYGTVWYCTVLLSTISSMRVPVRPHVLITEIQTVPSA